MDRFLWRINAYSHVNLLVYWNKFEINVTKVSSISYFIAVFAMLGTQTILILKMFIHFAIPFATI